MSSPRDNSADKISTNDKKQNCDSFTDCISDLISNNSVKSMKRFIQHSDVSCLEHCVNVSYYSFLVCRFLRLDCCSAARGGLLHDLFLYDWHRNSTEKPRKGMHAFTHPKIALQNAGIFNLNDIEKDIIKKHMWPLTIIPPRYPEALVVSFVDKYCAVIETFKLCRESRLRLKKLMNNA